MLTDRDSRIVELASGGLTYEEIGSLMGEEFGHSLTRERVRQILNRIGKRGQAKILSRKEARKLRIHVRWEEALPRDLRELAATLRKNELPFAPMPYKGATKEGSYALCRTRWEINGKICIIHRPSTGAPTCPQCHKAGPPHYKAKNHAGCPRYFRTSIRPRPYDFALFITPVGNIVLPKSEIPTHVWWINITAAKTCRWWQWEDAWHLLKQ